MPTAKTQNGLYQGIYEFQDPSGTLLAARIPAAGSIDLYDGTTVIVRPNQCAMFLYKGEVADILTQGTQSLKTANVPLLTRLANWRKGFQSPVRAEIWFFSGMVFTARRWGTAQPVLAALDVGSIPIRGYGNYNVFIRDPRKLFKKLIGTRTTFDVTEVEEFIQSQILAAFPAALEGVATVADLGSQHRDVAARLEADVAKRLGEFGLTINNLQVLALIPPKEVLDAIDAKIAMKVIGNPREYLIYKAANSLDALHESGGNDSMQMMLGMMIGKGLIGADYHEKEKTLAESNRPSSSRCASCNNVTDAQNRFCPHCGRELPK
jgi:membrane protease subunit (stomatin/prohibitin family)